MLAMLCCHRQVVLSQKEEHSDHELDERQFLVDFEQASTGDDLKACVKWIERHGGAVLLSMNEDYGRFLVVRMSNHICTSRP